MLYLHFRDFKTFIKYPVACSVQLLDSLPPAVLIVEVTVSCAQPAFGQVLLYPHSSTCTAAEPVDDFFKPSE